VQIRLLLLWLTESPIHTASINADKPDALRGVAHMVMCDNGTDPASALTSSEACR